MVISGTSSPWAILPVDIEKLQKLTIIKKCFRVEEIPTAWLLVHLLLCAKYEEGQGWCTIEECAVIAKICGIDQKDLMVIHTRHATLLHYSTVSVLCDKVLCNADIILPFKNSLSSCLLATSQLSIMKLSSSPKLEWFPLKY